MESNSDNDNIKYIKKYIPELELSDLKFDYDNYGESPIMRLKYLSDEDKKNG